LAEHARMDESMDKNRNGLFLSQHHCRQCGAVVCGPCSNKKLLLPGQGNGKAVRVCLQCYDAASKVKARPASTMDSSNNKDAQRNSADSSGGDSSGDEEEGNKEENHDEVRCIQKDTRI
jgi:hypothetical protein